MFSSPIAAGEFASSVGEAVAHHVAPPTAYNAGPLTICPAQYRAEIDGKPLDLSASEFRLLVRLMQSPGDVVTTAQLHAAIRSREADRIEAGNQVRPVIVGLRRKMPDGLIENVRGVGYRLSYE